MTIAASQTFRPIRYYSFAEPSGYGRSALAYLQGLHQAGVALDWQPMSWSDNGYQVMSDRFEPAKVRRQVIGTLFQGRSLDRSVMTALDSGCEYEVVIAHTVPEYYPKLYQPGKMNIGYTVWETDRLPHHWPDLLNQMDLILVPSVFCRKVFAAGGVTTPITVIPHVSPRVNRLVASADTDWLIRRCNICPDETIFYSINVWNPRKNPWRLLEAWMEAFRKDDNVKLVFKTSPTGPLNAESERYFPTLRMVCDKALESPNAAPVVVIDEVCAEARIRALHQRGDCYVSLAHGEGWGMGAYEAGQFARPVIMTGWGGQLDFLNADNAYLVDYRLVPVWDRLGRGSFAPDQNWAEPDLDAAIAAMRRVVADPEQAKARGLRLKAEIGEKFNFESVIRKMQAAIDGANP